LLSVLLEYCLDTQYLKARVASLHVLHALIKPHCSSGENWSARSTTPDTLHLTWW
jgi:hypothetical protein